MGEVSFSFEKTLNDTNDTEHILQFGFQSSSQTLFPVIFYQDTSCYNHTRSSAIPEFSLHYTLLSLQVLFILFQLSLLSFLIVLAIATQQITTKLNGL